MAHKILIVDDNALIRHGIRAAIEQRDGWTVCGEAENGQIAIEMVGTHQPHLVILDFSMPVMNGLEAAREISKIAPNVAIIMLTMHNFDGLADLAYKAGVKHVFSKPDGMRDQVFEAMTELLAA